jgi:HK97 gp10 family phage protein
MLKVNQAQLAALRERLKAVNAKAGKKAVRSAARKSMVPVRNQVRANAPEDKTDPDNVRIKDSVAITTKWRGTRLKVSVGIRGGAKENPETPWYFRLQEFGTKDMPARPFMAPALEGNAQEILDAVAAQLQKAIFE